MKTRTKLKIIVIAMLFETILLTLKQPLLYNIDKIAHFDTGVATTIFYYYTYLYKWVKIACYGFFVFYILNIESEYKHKIFGHFFIADFIVCLLDGVILTILSYMPDLATDVRHYTEIGIALATVCTSFLAGTFIYSKIRVPAFRTMRTAYRIWALRYFLYAFILTLEVLAHNFWDVGYLEMGGITWWIVFSWLLRMPLLVISRMVLLHGIYQMKTAKEQHDENKAKGIEHHHHHHHHHQDSEEAGQTADC